MEFNKLSTTEKIELLEYFKTLMKFDMACIIINVLNVSGISLIYIKDILITHNIDINSLDTGEKIFLFFSVIILLSSGLKVDCFIESLNELKIKTKNFKEVPDELIKKYVDTCN